MEDNLRQPDPIAEELGREYQQSRLQELQEASIATTEGTATPTQEAMVAGATAVLAESQASPTTENTDEVIDQLNSVTLPI